MAVKGPDHQGRLECILRLVIDREYPFFEGLFFEFKMGQGPEEINLSKISGTVCFKVEEKRADRQTMMTPLSFLMVDGPDDIGSGSLRIFIVVSKWPKGYGRIVFPRLSCCGSK